MEVNEGLFIIVPKRLVPEETIEYYKVSKEKGIPRVVYYQLNRNCEEIPPDEIISTMYRKIPDDFVGAIKKLIRNKEEYEPYEKALISAYSEGGYIAQDAFVINHTPESLSINIITDQLQRIRETKFLNNKKLTFIDIGLLCGSVVDVVDLIIMAKNCFVKVYLKAYDDIIWLAWNGKTVRPVIARLDKWIFMNENHHPLSFGKLLNMCCNICGFSYPCFGDVYEIIGDVSELLDIPIKQKTYDGAIVKRNLKDKTPLSIIFLRHYFDQYKVSEVKTGDALFNEYVSWKYQKIKEAEINKDKELAEILDKDDISSSKIFTQTIEEHTGRENKGDISRIKPNPNARRWKIHIKL